MAKLKIFKGKEFKVCVTDRISESDLFFEEYKKAARMLDEIKIGRASCRERV